jgi:hypothetical protein
MYRWNIVIGDVCHEQQILSTTFIERFNKNGRGMRGVELVVVVVRPLHMNN